MAKKGEFTRVSISTTLIEQVDNIIQQKDTLYPTRASFVDDAVRKLINETKTEYEVPSDLKKIFKFIKKFAEKESVEP